MESWQMKSESFFVIPAVAAYVDHTAVLSDAEWESLMMPLTIYTTTTAH